MDRRDVGGLLVASGCILLGVQLVPHTTDAGAAMLALAVGGLIYWFFRRKGD